MLVYLLQRLTSLDYCKNNTSDYTFSLDYLIIQNGDHANGLGINLDKYGGVQVKNFFLILLSKMER